MVEQDFAGRTVLVTGAGRNIGRAVVLEFASRGANVVVNARSNRPEAEAVAEEARALGVGALAVIGDVGDPDRVQEMAAEALKTFGGVDIYVSNAAVRRRQPFLEISVADWRGIMESNLSASFYLGKALVPGMLERGWGRVIHVAGHDGWVGEPLRAHNVTAKAGLHGLTKAMALELSPQGITVNTVVYGAFDTERDPVHYPDWDPRTHALKVAVGRIGRPEEAAKACAYLASDAAAYVTGQALHINGGQHMF